MEAGTRGWTALRAGSWQTVAGVGVLWTADDGSVRAWLEPGSEVLLERLQCFDRLEAHRQRLAPLLADAASVDRVLQLLAARGLLVDAAECLAPGGASEDGHPPARPPLIAIRAYRRAAGLARLLDGLRAHEAQFGRRWRYLVVDDTREGDPQVAAVVADARRQGLSARLLSAARREAWLDSIARRVPAFAPHGPLRPLLDPAFPAATGARAWNAALLFGAGGSLTLLDDDFHLPWRARTAGAGTELRGSARQRIAYHRDGGAPEPAASFDVLSAAHALCGQRPHDALPLAAEDAAGLTAAQLGAWRERRIGAVLTGTYGAYAWDSTVFLNLAAHAGAPDGLWAVPFDAARLEGDAVSVAVDRPTLLPHGGFTPVAIDLRELAPFASTVGKADDVAFLHLLGALRRRHCAVEMPWLVGHAPPEPRQRRRLAELPLVADPNVLFGARVAHLADGIDGGDPSARWDALCALARAVAGEDDAALGAIARRWRTATVSQVVMLARRALDSGRSAPAPWREHATRVLHANQQALVGADPALAGLVDGLRTAMAQLAQGAAWADLWSLAQAEAGAWYEALGDC